MADEGGFDRRGVFRFFEQCFEPSGGTGEEKGFDFTHSLDVSVQFARSPTVQTVCSADAGAASKR